MSDYLDFARRGRNSWWTYVLTTPLALALWVVALVIGTIAGAVPADARRTLLDPSHPAMFYGGTGAIFGALLLAFIGAIRLVHGKRFGDIVGAWRWRLTGIGAAAWLILCAVAAAVDFAIEPGGFHLTASPRFWTLAAWAAPSLAIQTFAEEFIFRGYVTQGLLLAIRRPVPTAVVSGLIFAALHIPNGWPQAAGALMFGIVTALIAMRTASLAMTWGLHLVNNLFGALVVVSANDVLHGSPGLLAQTTPNLVWLDAAASIVAFLVLWAVVIRARVR
jgi:membrane protease YdiL (CAAX protease family)